MELSSTCTCTWHVHSCTRSCTAWRRPLRRSQRTRATTSSRWPSMLPEIRRFHLATRRLRPTMVSRRSEGPRRPSSSATPRGPRRRRPPPRRTRRGGRWARGAACSKERSRVHASAKSVSSTPEIASLRWLSRPVTCARNRRGMHGGDRGTSSLGRRGPSSCSRSLPAPGERDLTARRREAMSREPRRHDRRARSPGQTPAARDMPGERLGRRASVHDAAKWLATVWQGRVPMARSFEGAGARGCPDRLRLDSDCPCRSRGSERETRLTGEESR